MFIHMARQMDLAKLAYTLKPKFGTISWLIAFPAKSSPSTRSSCWLYYNLFLST